MLSALIERYVRFARRRAGLLVAAFGALAVVALGFALRLELHTDMAELLPDEHPAVLALRRVAPRQRAASNLMMLVSSPDAEANRRFVRALRRSLENLVGRVFTEIQWKPDGEIPAYAARWQWLYADEKDLAAAEALLDRVVAQRSSPFTVDLEGDPEEELRALRQRLDQKLPAARPGDHFEALVDGRHYLGVMLWKRSEGLAAAGDRETRQLVEELVRRAEPARFHAGMKVEYTGAIAQAIDEQDGIREDLTLATALCATLVLLSIWLYFRRAAVLIVVGAPAVLGLFLSLTIASLTIHYLNINTAFLISIILGNGINSPIILLARYGEERRGGRAAFEALPVAMRESLLGTITAMTAASIAYGSLLATSFRGFNQFGLLGGAGMLLVWIVTFLMVPPMVLFGERHWPGVLTPGRNLLRAPFVWLGRLVERRPAALAAISFALVAVAAVPMARYARDPLEWNFHNLRTEETPSQRLWPTMEKLGMGDVGAGYVGNNGVLLVDDPSQADAVAEALRAQDLARGDQHVLKEVRTLSSQLPKRQPEKLEILSRIRRKIDRHKELLGDDEAKEVAAWRPPDELRVLGVDDLPKLVRDAFTETDGQRGRLVGVDADYRTYSDWNGHDLLRMSKALRVEALGKTWYTMSAAGVFAGMLETIIADGPRVTAIALVGVVLLVLVAFGLRGGVVVLLAQAIGMVWLVGILGALPLKINFMNFVAIPITLGVGVDYAANVWARMRGGGSVAGAIADTGSAVALCSLTTIIGYSSLLLARNRALRSFGLLADLGEVSCLAAALVAMPAILKLVARRRGEGSGVEPTSLAR